MALAGLRSPDRGAGFGAQSVEVAVFVNVPDVDVAPGYDKDPVGIQPLLVLNGDVVTEVGEECVVSTSQRATKKQKGSKAG